MSMHLRLHVPYPIDVPDDWSALQRTRLQQVIARAFERAVSGFHIPTAHIEIVREVREVREEKTRSEVRLAQQRGDPKERVDAARLRNNGARYSVPGYDDGGKPVDVPAREDVTRSGKSSSSGPLIIQTSAGDRITEENFPQTLVIYAVGNNPIHVGGSPYIIAGNLARALRWGNLLFGAQGYAVLQPRKGSPAGPFYVVKLLKPLNLKDLGNLGTSPTQEGEMVGAFRSLLVSSTDYLTVTVVTNGVPLLSNIARDFWNIETFKNVVERISLNEGSLRRDEVQMAVNTLLRKAHAAEGESGEVDVIVKMDRTIFAVMPWEKRVEYLILLIDAWTWEREEIAILEIIHASRNVAELEAIFALLREKGKYEQLFDDLDGRVFELLQMLGEYRVGQPLNWDYLAKLLLKIGFLPPVMVEDTVQELKDLAAGLLDWLQSTWEGIKFLFTKPLEVLEGLGHLVELLWIVDKAQSGDPEAQAFVTQMVVQACSATAKAIRGLEYAEELGTPYGHRGGGTSIGGGILRRLRAAIIFEVLSWFIGIGEIRAAIKAAATLPERLAALMDVIRSLRFVGKAAEAGTTAARLERVLVALARLAEITEEARVLRLAELLPEEHVALLQRIADAVELHEGEGIEALLAKLHGKTELLQGVDRLGDALHIAGRLEERAASIGGVTAEMTKGLHALMRHSGWDKATMLRLIEDVPAGRLQEFLHTMTFVKPYHLEKWGVQAFKELAEHPRALAFIREAGSDLLDITYGYTGRSWERFEAFLDGLAIRREQIGNPADYQRFLERLAKGEASAFDEVAQARHAQRLAEATKLGKTAELGLKRLQEGQHTHLLEEMAEIAEHKVALHNRRASQLAQLTDKELNGLEQIARLESEYVDWGDTLENLLQWSAGDRADLLGLVADIGPHTTSGLDDVLRGVLSRKVKEVGKMVEGVQGSWGQLYAARTLVKDYGARGSHFEVSATRREIDIVAQTPFGRLHVEVKTNLENLAGEAEASFEKEQIIKDLVAHAHGDYKDLLYLYHPDVADQLPGLGQRMLRLFDGEELPKLLKQRGIDVKRARRAFEHWLPKGLKTYSL